MLSDIAQWVLPLVLSIIFCFSLCKKIKIFDCFVRGAVKGLKTLYGIFPTVVALVIAVTMLRESGATELIASLFSPVASALGIPEEIIPVAMLTPVSGGGSMSLFRDTLEVYGPDSFIGQVASVLMGSTDTTFYAVSIYFGAVSIKKTRHTLVAGLAADFTSLVLSSFFVKLFL
ncbi:MAG: spore maturation protein [Clostridia bacterium]|nr:spore maturation protein [Clostridia bacterium]